MAIVQIVSDQLGSFQQDFANDAALYELFQSWALDNAATVEATVTIGGEDLNGMPAGAVYRITSYPDPELEQFADLTVSQIEGA